MTLNIAILLLSLANLILQRRACIIAKRRWDKQQRIIDRNNEVYKFRLWILNNMEDKYKQLPPYEEMVYDGKPLKLESYFSEILN
jgi:hypothetical protein